MSDSTPTRSASEDSTNSSLALRVGVARKPEQAAALALILGDDAHDQAATLLAAEREGRISLTGLLTATRGDSLVGAGWGLAQPGRTALIWPPRLRGGEPESTATLLLTAACEHVTAAGVRLAQAALPQSTGIDAERLIAQGFSLLADLLFLVADADVFPTSRPAVPFRLDSFRPEDDVFLARLIRLIEQTYQGTHDCPELNGVRETTDVLAGYQGTGEFAPERWLIAADGETDVGCLLLADHPAQEQWELVYLGVTPKARGWGLGLALTRHAQWLTGQAGRRRLVLAVDARNAPALAIYSAAGMVLFDRRSVLLKVP